MRSPLLTGEQKRQWVRDRINWRWFDTALALLFGAAAVNERHGTTTYAIFLAVACLNSAFAVLAWVLAFRYRP